MKELLPQMTHAEWMAEAEKRFGPDPMKWRFVCPSCGHVAACEDWKAAGAESSDVGLSCIGRWTGSTQQIFSKAGGPCNYAGFGLFRINPQPVLFEDGKVSHAFAFAFADAPKASP